MAVLLLASGPADLEGAAPAGPSSSIDAGQPDNPAPPEPAKSEAPPATQPVIAPPPAEPLAAENLDGGDISVIARRQKPLAGDPLEAVNIKTFEITQAVDRAVVRPMAKGYQRALPDPLRSGIRNAINNLREPAVFLNFMLQHKIGKAAETFGRFAINSTIGVAGLFDMARRKPFHLPRRKNGFANTMGFYGVKTGIYMYLPLAGATTTRDLIGDTLDRLVLPIAIGGPFRKPQVGIPIWVASTLDQRAEFDEKLEEIHKDSDPYAKTRDDYLRHRQAEIDALHVKRRKKSAAQPQAATPSPAGGDPATP